MWLHCFDHKAGGWGRLGDMAVGQCGCGAAALGTCLYAFGGEDANVEEERACMTLYNTATRKVEEVAKPPRTLSDCAGVACGGLVYSLGGIPGDRGTGYLYDASVADVCIYSPDIGTWVDGPALPTALSDLAAAEHSGCIYVCGAKNTPDGALLILDPRTRA